jgi:hypothetical protein
VQAPFLNLIENIFYKVGTVPENRNAQVLDFQALTRARRARPCNVLMLNDLLQELCNLNFIRSLKQVGASKKTRFLSA